MLDHIDGVIDDFVRSEDHWLKAFFQKFLKACINYLLELKKMNMLEEYLTLNHVKNRGMLDQTDGVIEDL